MEPSHTCQDTSGAQQQSKTLAEAAQSPEDRPGPQPQPITSANERNAMAENLEGGQPSIGADMSTNQKKAEPLPAAHVEPKRKGLSEEGKDGSCDHLQGRRGCDDELTKAAHVHYLVQKYVLVQREKEDNAETKALSGRANMEDTPSQGNASIVNDVAAASGHWRQVQRDIENGIAPLPSQHQVSVSSFPGAYAQGGMARNARATLTIDHGQPFEDAASASDKSSLISSGNLAVANPVVGEELPDDLPHALEWSQSDHEELDAKATASFCKRNKWRLLPPCLLLIAVLVIVAVTTSLSGSTDQSHRHEAASILQRRSPDEYLISVLPQHTVDELENKKSPQSKAFQWLLGDPQYQSGTYPAWRVIQRFALATFYYSTGGNSTAGWIRSDNWMSYDHHECTWYMSDAEDVIQHANPNGLVNPQVDLSQCSGEKLQNIGLVSNNLQGTLPPEFYLLTDLQGVSLRSNKLSGSLTSHIAGFTNLMGAIDLIGNEIRGSIPTEIGLLHKMDGLFLIHNQISGTIPTQIGRLSSLRLLFADANALTGPIPSQVGALPEIEKVEVMQNHLTGTLPTQLARLKLSFVSWGNSLTGSIPSEFGSNHNMELLVLGGSSLTGTLPTQLGAMQGMNNLCVLGTQVNGTMPTELGNLSRLVTLQLANNKISGTMPSELRQLSSLNALSVSNNIISGTLPSTLGELNSMLGMVFDKNNISGSIPSQLGGLPNLEVLGLSSNVLSGSMPSELGQATSLQELRLDHNKLTGSIPSSLGLLFHKSFSWIETYYSIWALLPDAFKTADPSGTLSLSNNHFVGVIPSEFGLMKNLYSFSAEGNSLMGRIPSQLGFLSKLDRLVLNSNLLSGPISPWLGQASSLTILNVANNSLTGTVPHDLLTDLLASGSGYVDISSNLLAGTVPFEYCTLDSGVFAFDCSDSLCGCNCKCPLA